MISSKQIEETCSSVLVLIEKMNSINEELLRTPNHRFQHEWPSSAYVANGVSERCGDVDGRCDGGGADLCDCREVHDDD